MKRYKQLFLALLFSLCVLGCGTLQKQCSPSNISMTDSQLEWVDSLLQYGLDNEALYTLMGNIKPISSLKIYTFPVANTDSSKRLDGHTLTRAEHGKYLDRMAYIVRSMNALHLPGLCFVMVPYRAPYKEMRTLQITAVRTALMDSVLRAQESFYGQFGLVPGADPNMVLSVIEHLDDYERWRAYGYLFGYPDHAVDFFNQAAARSKQEGKISKRSFFRIPTFQDEERSNFVYAVPADYQPTATDSSYLHRARPILETYKKIRPRYTRPNGTVQAYKLLQDYYRQSNR